MRGWRAALGWAPPEGGSRAAGPQAIPETRQGPACLPAWGVGVSMIRTSAVRRHGQNVRKDTVCHYGGVAD